MAIWDNTQNNGPWKTPEGTNKANDPENTTDSGHAEGRAANIYDHDLAANYDGGYAQKPVVSEHAFKDIEFVIKATIVEHVEDLHPYECVKDDCS